MTIRITPAPPAAAPVVAPAAPTVAAPAGPPVPDYMDPRVIAERTARGRVAENTPDTLPADVIDRGAPKYFRTYEQLKAAAYALQEKYPDLVEVKDIGDSWEKVQGKADRDIIAITLTNRKATGAKPIVEHIAGVHAREIANPEMLMTWAQQLLEGYGRDPESTMLLDTRQIDLIPMVNPDGHAVIERGYAGAAGGDLMKRRNTSGTNGQGTDLNRNFEFHWGGAGASTSPGSDTYRGPSASSEPEVQAVQNYTKARKPAMFTDWHSYSRLNMYPWGDTRSKAPDYEGLKNVAEKMSTFNHYSPVQSIDLYPTTGTSDDTAYGAYGIPSWAVETGGSFHQSDDEFRSTLAENLPILDYQAKIAANPFALVKGPDAIDVLVDAAAGKVSAVVSDASSGRKAIAGAELIFDVTAAPGSGIPLSAADGQFNSDTERVGGAIKLPPASSPLDGKLVYVRAKDADGNWGPLTPQWLTGPAGAPVQ